MAEASRTRQLENEIFAVNYRGTLLGAATAAAVCVGKHIDNKDVEGFWMLFFCFFIGKNLIVRSRKAIQTRANSQIPFINALQKMLSTRTLFFLNCRYLMQCDFLKKN